MDDPYETLGLNKAGLLEIIPVSPDTRYIAALTRYGLATGRPARFSFASW